MIYSLIVAPLILSVRTSAEVNGPPQPAVSNKTWENARNMFEVTECDETWVDASSVGLGYLWFETSAAYNYSSAIAFCERRNSSLIEIDSKEQWNFTITKLETISEKVPFSIDAFGESMVKAWWGGASDEEKEGEWVWTKSGVPVQEFVWGEGQPNNYKRKQNYFCFHKQKGQESFEGNDDIGSTRYYPLCQKKR